MIKEQPNENSTNGEDPNTEWDNSGNVEKQIYLEAKNSYQKVWDLFDNLEDKANRTLTRDFVFFSLIFTGISFLITQNFDQVYLEVLFALTSFIVITLSFGIWYNIGVQKVRKFEMLVPSKMIDMADSAPTIKRLYRWLISELEEAGKSYESVCSDKGNKLEKAMVCEGYAVIGIMVAIIWTIFGYFFLKS